MALGCCIPTSAVQVKVTMNAVSTTMSLAEKETGVEVEVGAPANKVYTFDVPAGEYVLTAYATNGSTVNGTIVLPVSEDGTEQEFTVLTNTAYVTNKNADNSTWSVENGDYTLDVTVNTREGSPRQITVGSSSTAGRYTFLALNGNSYTAAFMPSEEHRKEGYTTLYKSGTLTFNVTVSGKIPMAADYSITLPKDAELMIGMKFTHFTDFKAVEPVSTEIKGDTKVVTYSLADGQVYNYRTWLEGGLTQGGYFTMYVDETKQPEINFSSADYEAFNPKTVNHDVKSNQGYETGDIFVNINPQGHLRLAVGDSYNAHAMRTWELTENSTNNYFIEPDFHYTVVDLDGNPSTGVIEIDNADTSVSAWSRIKAVGEGTAIVLVTYDAIGLNYYSGLTKTPYMGGEYWGAIWPENTAAYVVTVGQPESTVVPNMVINSEYNQGALKVAGQNVDAEHDVFYYLDTEPGAYYTFTPEGAENITIAYPEIGENSASYHGFSAEGVTKNADGSYTLLLKEGRQIVRLTDAAGNSAYQVLTAKPCHREITNVSAPGSGIFQPGDEVKIQYSGLRHPANKLAGIYNMSAYVTYNGIPNGSSLILGSGQYTFGSAASAQAVSVVIPSDYDVEATPNIEMTKGVIQVNGYGDPIGNHRIIDPVAGRSPNFTAVAHKTYFGMLPDVSIPISSYRSFPIIIKANATIDELEISYRGKALNADEATSMYTGSYGTYDVFATAEGQRCYRNTFTIADDAEGTQTFNIDFTPLAEGAWDGKTLSEPAAVDGVYKIATGAELAWYAAEVNKGNNADALLIDDIDLGDFAWTPIGNNSKNFTAAFNGNGHTVSGLYIGSPTANYQGLFGYAKGKSESAPCLISGITLYGHVSAKQYSAGIVGYINQYTTVDECANYADVVGAGTYIGGIVGYIGNATGKVTNCYNAGSISGTTNCGGVIGAHFANVVVENVFNVATVTGSSVGACVGGTSSKANMKNMFAIAEYNIVDAHTLVSEEQMASGEVAHLLGESFGQTLGEHPHPVHGGESVYRIDYDVIAVESRAAEEETSDENVLYTNGKLPGTINGKKVEWYADEDLTLPVTTVQADHHLYARIDNGQTGIDTIEPAVEMEAEWYNLQGLKVKAPQEGERGIYIRVQNGKSQKIIL